LSHPVLFCFTYFCDGVAHLCWAGLDFYTLIHASHITGMTDEHLHAQLLVEMGSQKLFASLALHHNPPDLPLPSSWD
jgi:hypothetical protein